MPEEFHPGLSIDCVIFGFHSNELRVLLLKMKKSDRWALPGGFIKKEEDLEAATGRVLKDRTGLDHIFLTQFYLFGKYGRNNLSHATGLIEEKIIPEEAISWFRQRFLSVGYYSLVEYSMVNPQPDFISDACEWFSLSALPELILDHQEIVNRALETLRMHLNYEPIGLNLLPPKFTMPELQALYETVLGRALDRRNFQRKMLGYGILIRHEERRKGGAHKAPYLYSFDRTKYHRALAEGLKPGW